MSLTPVIYEASPATLADGQQAQAHCDSKGRLLASMVIPPATTGGLTPLRILTGTTGVIKASAGQVYAIVCYNVNAAVRYLHVYNKATAPTLSTDTPLVTIPIPATSMRDISFADLGVAFSTGISWAFTTDDVAIPTTAGASTELHATVFYA